MTGLMSRNETICLQVGSYVTPMPKLGPSPYVFDTFPRFQESRSLLMNLFIFNLVTCPEKKCLKYFNTDIKKAFPSLFSLQT